MLELGYTQYVAQGEKQHISLQMFAAQDRDVTILCRWLLQRTPTHHCVV